MRIIGYVTLLLLLVGMGNARPVHAEGEKLSCFTVSIIVPADVGSGSDLVARTFAEAATKVAGMSFRVRNRPRDIADRLMEKADPDGCTLMLDTQIRVAFELLKTNLREWDDYKPVAMLARTPLALAMSRSPAAANGKSEQIDLREVVSGLMKTPESVTFGLVDDPLERMLFLELEEGLGVRFRIRRYDAGVERYRDLLNAGSGLVGFVSLQGAKAHMKDGTLAILGVTTISGSDVLPDVPAISNNASSVAFGVDQGIFAPVGTPDALIKLHIATIEKVMEEDGIFSALHKDYGTEPHVILGDEFSRYLENMAADWTEMLQRKENKSRLGQKS